MQETFLRAARHAASVPDGAGHEEAWLVRVLINLARDRWRQAAVRKRGADDAAFSTTPVASDTESALLARSIVWQALDRLPPRRRAIIVLYEIEGVGIPAIARLLGVAAVTVRWHLSIGRRELAAAVDGRTGTSGISNMTDINKLLNDGDPLARGRRARCRSTRERMRRMIVCGRAGVRRPAHALAASVRDRGRRQRFWSSWEP